MKVISLAAFAAAVVAAVPASADVIHQTSLDLDGETVSVSYEPRARTILKQRGIGPRTMQTCAWKSIVSVERRIAGADGRSIEALTKEVGEAKVSSGVAAGYCNHVRDRQTAPFGGNRSRLEAFLAEVAERDARSLRIDLASLGSLRRISR